MKVKRMGITEILRRIWLFSANKIKSSESFSKQPTQLIVELNSSLQHVIVTKYTCENPFQVNPTTLYVNPNIKNCQNSVQLVLPSVCFFFKNTEIGGQFHCWNLIDVFFHLRTYIEEIEDWTLNFVTKGNSWL